MYHAINLRAKLFTCFSSDKQAKASLDVLKASLDVLKASDTPLILKG
jgi:hypothetical protein